MWDKINSCIWREVIKKNIYMLGYILISIFKDILGIFFKIFSGKF